MPGQTIGKTMDHGYAGSYARQPDMIVDAHPLGGDSRVVFGTALVYDGAAVVPFGPGHAATDFVGVAAREVKSALDYTAQGVGQYQPGDATSVFKRGNINVVCNVGAPSLGGKVYLRIEKNDAIPTGVVGEFEAQEDTGKTVELPGCQWRGGADANRVAELSIMARNRA